MSLRRPALASLVVALALGPVLLLASPADAGGGCHRPGQTEGRGNEVRLALNCMNPTVLHAEPGETVRFVYDEKDGVEHNLIGVGWGIEQLLSGQTFSQSFAAEGTYPFACTIHPGMVGAIVVQDGAAAATVADSLDAQPIQRTEATSADGSSAGWAIAVVVGAVLVLGLGGGFLRSVCRSDPNRA